MGELSSPKTLQKTPDMTDYLCGLKEIPIVGQRYLNTLFNEDSSSQPQVRKFIFSATLTQDVGKLASLKMSSPEIISIHPESQLQNDTIDPTADDAMFSLPSTLHEYVVAAKKDKPLLLLYLLNKYRLQDKTLIFAHSTETATRLNHLLTQFYKSTHANITTAVISSQVPLKTRKKLVSSLTTGKLNMYNPHPKYLI
jgi:ATP-dependent RNA helicase DDX51/DBP6